MVTVELRKEKKFQMSTEKISEKLCVCVSRFNDIACSIKPISRN